MWNVWWTGWKWYHICYVHLDFPLPFVVLTMLHPHIWFRIASVVTSVEPGDSILPHSYHRESISLSLSSYFSFSLINLFWGLRNCFVEWYNFGKLLPWSEAPHVFNLGTRWKCVLIFIGQTGRTCPVSLNCSRPEGTTLSLWGADMDI
jgi:hypothetical protein